MKFKPFEVSSIWEFKDPDTGHIHEASSEEALLAYIKQYRINNDLEEIEYLPDVVTHYLCNLPINKGKCIHSPLKRGLFQTIKGGVALIKNMMYSSFVPQEVADVRSEICSKCPKNVFPDKGPFIKWSDNVALQTIGSRKSKFHDSLGNCEVCSCPLRAKVFYAGKLELSESEIKEMPDYCWQKKEYLKNGR